MFYVSACKSRSQNIYCVLDIEDLWYLTNSLLYKGYQVYIKDEQGNVINKEGLAC